MANLSVFEEQAGTVGPPNGGVGQGPWRQVRKLCGSGFSPLNHSLPWRAPCLDVRPSCLCLSPPGFALTLPYIWCQSIQASVIKIL